MRGLVALIAIPLVALAAACQAPDDVTPPDPPLTFMPCRGNFPTGPQMISDPEWSIFLAGIDLPSEVRIASGRRTTSPTDPHLVDLYLDLCFPRSAGMYALLPAATGIARSLKQNELGARTATLTISCVCEDLAHPVEVRDRDYQRHPWDGTPSPEAELTNWEKTAD